MKKENEVQEKQLEQVIGGNGGGAINNDGATNPIQGGAIYNDGMAAGVFGLGKSGALAPNEVPQGGAIYNDGTDHAGIGGGGKK